MPRSQRPRKRYDPRRHVTDINPAELAFGQAAALQPVQRAKLLQPALTAFDAFRRGAGSAAMWGDIAQALNMAEALARRNIANDHAEKFEAGQQALADVLRRKSAGGSFTLKAAEIAALDDALQIHEIQLRYCSTREWLESEAEVARKTRGALAGNVAPGTHVLVADMDCAAISSRVSR